MNINNKTEYRAVLRSGQYYIGPSTPDIFFEYYNWNTYKISESLYVAAHPRLNVEQTNDNGKVVTLIGFIIDPEEPKLNDFEVTASLLTHEAFYTDPFESTVRLGGRWVMIVSGQNDTYIFSDPAALRQVYYTFHGGGLHCASEPGLLAEVCGLDIDPDAEEFSKSPAFQANKEFWWPGNTTPFREIKCLLPNFYLSERKKIVRRFWPIKEIEKREAEDVVSLVVKRLQGMVDAISFRGRIAVSITAGIDSRMMLAASHNHKNNLEIVTVKQRGMPNSHSDIQIPQLFSKKYGLHHTVIDANVKLRNDFRKAYQESVFSYHEKWLPDAQSIYDQYHQEAIVLVGSLVETTRLFPGRIAPDTYNKTVPIGFKLSAMDLSNAVGLGSHPFAVHAYKNWLNSADQIFNYDLGDLFYWEQRSGRWLASAQLEFSLAWKDILTPFNSREIISALLATDPKLRSAPESIIFKLIIGNLWLDLLSEPINPIKTNVHLSFVKRVVRRLKKRLMGLV